MALFNYATKEITLKIVYYGPGLSGKTTNLQYLHQILNTSSKGKLLSLSTEADRTLFFDFLPVELGKIRDFSIRFQLYTVPGQVRYNATRKIVLKGADAVVFVADSQRAMREQNIESLENMRENLIANNIDPGEIPVVFQYNKRDLKDISSTDELNGDLNDGNYPVVEGEAINGTGVEEAFKLISKLLLQFISRKHKIEIEPAEEIKKAQPSPPPVSQTFQTEGPKSLDIFPERLPSEGSAGSREETVSPDISAPEGLETTAHQKPEAVEESPPSPSAVSYSREAEEWEAPTILPPEPGVAEAEPEPTEHEQDTTSLHSRSESVLGKSGGESDITMEKLAVAPVSRETFDQLMREVGEIHAILDSLKDSLSGMSAEIKALSRMKKAQEETNNLLRGFKDAFATLKTRKRWFRF